MSAAVLLLNCSKQLLEGKAEHKLFLAVTNNGNKNSGLVSPNNVPSANCKESYALPQSFRILIVECESVFVGCCFFFFFRLLVCVSELTSVHVSPQKVFLCDRGEKLRKTETNIRNLGLGAKNKN